MSCSIALSITDGVPCIEEIGITGTCTNLAGYTVLHFPLEEFQQYMNGTKEAYVIVNNGIPVIRLDSLNQQTRFTELRRLIAEYFLDPNKD